MPVRIVYVLLALAGLPVAALGGPITFDYRVDTHILSGTPSPGLLTPLFEPPVRQTLEAGAPWEIGAIEFGYSDGPQAADSYTAFTPAVVTVALTDLASGRTGSLRMDVNAVDEWTRREWDGRWLNTRHVLELGTATGGDVASTSAILGGTEYVLTATARNDRTQAVFTLTATPAVATPEPGTFLLGTLALLPVAALRRRRG